MLHLVEQLEVAGGLMDLEAQVRVRLGHTRRHPREHPDAHALVRAHAERARVALAERLELSLRDPKARQNRLRVLEQQRPRLGQPDGPAPPGPVDERLADQALQRRDLLADRGLRVPELVRGAPERPGRGDRLERRQIAQLQPQPAVRPHRPNLPAACCAPMQARLRAYCDRCEKESELFTRSGR